MGCDVKTIIKELSDLNIEYGLEPIKVDSVTVRAIVDLVTVGEKYVALVSSTKEHKKDGKLTPTLDSLPEYTESSKSMTYAGIGSRQTPKGYLEQMTKIAKKLDKLGYKLQTGLTFGNKKEGADGAFIDGSSQGSRELFSPESIVKGSPEWKVAEEVHGNFKALTKKGDSGAKLMARNTNQVFGKNLDNPVDFVIAWTPLNGEGEVVTHHSQVYYDSKNKSNNTGGTGQAITLASKKGIPVINMADPKWEEQLDAILNKDESKPLRDSIENSEPTKTYHPLIVRPSSRADAVTTHNSGEALYGGRVGKNDNLDGLTIINNYGNPFLTDAEAKKQKRKGYGTVEQVSTMYVDWLEGKIKGPKYYEPRREWVLEQIKKGLVGTKFVYPNMSSEYWKDPDNNTNHIIKLIELINGAGNGVQEDTNIKYLTTSFTRPSVEKDTDSVYIFTDNAARTSGGKTIPNDSAYVKEFGEEGKTYKYPTNTTQAVIRGLDNALPISTMRFANTETGQWTEATYDEFTKTIDREIEYIKSKLDGKTLKVSLGKSGKIGQGAIASLPKKHQEYLDKKLLEVGITNGKIVKKTGKPVDKKDTTFSKKITDWSKELKDLLDTVDESTKIEVFEKVNDGTFTSYEEITKFLNDSKKGININKYQSGLGYRLTNPTDSTAKGTFFITPSFELKNTPKSSKNVEGWYKANNAKVMGIPEGPEGDAYDVELMSKLIADKFTQHPALGEEVEAKGGVEFLEASTHNVFTANTNRASRWENIGKGKGLFIEALVTGYKLSKKVPTINTEVTLDDTIVAGKIPVEFSEFTGTEETITIQNTLQNKSKQKKPPTYRSVYNILKKQFSKTPTPKSSRKSTESVPTTYEEVLFNIINNNKPININMSIALAVNMLSDPKTSAGRAEGNTITLPDFDGIISNKNNAVAGVMKKTGMTKEEVITKAKEYKEHNFTTETKLHEAIHVGSVKYMQDNPNSKYTKQVEDLFTKVLKIAEDNKSHPLNNIHASTGVAYWKTNVQEFIAVALSNKEMITLLNDIKVTDSTSLLHSLLDTLRKMLKINGSSVTEILLDSLLHMNAESTTTIKEKTVQGEPVTEVGEQIGDVKTIPVKGGEVKVVGDFLSHKEVITLRQVVKDLMQKDYTLGSNFDDRKKHKALVIAPKNLKEDIRYEYYNNSHAKQVFKDEKDREIFETLMKKVSTTLGHENDYFNHILINDFIGGIGISMHHDAEGFYVDFIEGVPTVGAVAVVSIGDTVTNHVIGGEATYSEHKKQFYINKKYDNAKESIDGEVFVGKVPTGSLVEMSTGKLSHTVGKAGKDGRISITFRHIAKSNLIEKQEVKEKKTYTLEEELDHLNNTKTMKGNKNYSQKSQIVDIILPNGVEVKAIVHEMLNGTKLALIKDDEFTGVVEISTGFQIEGIEGRSAKDKFTSGITNFMNKMSVDVQSEIDSGTLNKDVKPMNQTTDTKSNKKFDEKLNKKLQNILKKLFPNIKLDYTTKDIDTEGNIRGQANIDAQTVLINSLLQSQDTLPHEYAHHYIAMFRDTPIVQEAIKKWGSEEALVQAIGEQVVEQKGIAYGWWKKFSKWIRSKFNKLDSTTKEEIRDTLTNNFLIAKKLGTKKSISDDMTLALYTKVLGQLETLYPDIKENVDKHTEKEFTDAIESYVNSEDISIKKYANIYVDMLEKSTFVNKLITRVSKDYTITREDAKAKIAEGVKKELLDLGLGKSFDNSTLGRLIRFIKRTFAKIFNKKQFERYKTDFSIKQLALNVYNGENAEAISYKHKAGTKKVNPTEDFKQQPEAANVIYDVMEASNNTAIFTGSEALAMQGTIYRKQGKKGTDLHDLDFVLRDSDNNTQHIITKLSKNNELAVLFDFNIPTNEGIMKFIAKANILSKINVLEPIGKYASKKFLDSNNILTLAVTPKGVTIQNIVRYNKQSNSSRIVSYDLVDKNNKIVGTYKANIIKNSSGFTTTIESEHTTGVKAIWVDLIEDKNLTKDETFNWTAPNGSIVTVSKAAYTFDAKNSMAPFIPRTKDVRDFNSFYVDSEKEIGKLKPEYKNKIIVANSGSGKTLLANSDEKIIDSDDILIKILGIDSIDDIVKAFKKIKNTDEVYKKLAEELVTLRDKGYTILTPSTSKHILNIADVAIIQNDKYTIQKRTSNTTRTNNINRSLGQAASSINYFKNNVENSNIKLVELVPSEFLSDELTHNNENNNDKIKNLEEKMYNKYKDKINNCK